MEGQRDRDRGKRGAAAPTLSGQAPDPAIVAIVVYLARRAAERDYAESEAARDSPFEDDDEN
jgi:hypothetical protein